ncbi:uncharacterized protein EV420DRAFT_1552050 [Desarmillaria tabescens]|uniref:HNH nuclease domain-containing protein n=1 Tax=Armillaria tabescens TaxID=1929756 RepID=A0AA39N4K1_ARMTA|nr:uncharacterized protein EV420DRAFT_1552050 [Desarmillaria tabescens]KAK0457189.1 hypothetical protein EV420DRAFT_1552050 [Desarmillaria tabescens]
MPPGMAVDKPPNERFLRLEIPVTIINASARRGRKWLLYVATAIAGTHGYLHQDGRDLQPEDMQRSVVDNEIYDFVTEAAVCVADAQCGDTRTSSNAGESRLHNRESIRIRDGGRCVVLEPGIMLRAGSRHRLEVASVDCQAAHILPHAKGSTYLEAVVQARGLNENVSQFDGGIDDEKNALFMDTRIHAVGLTDQTCAFLYVPNLCMTMEDVLYPEEHPPPPLPESLQHTTEHIYLQFQMLAEGAYIRLADYMVQGRLWNNKFIRMPDDRSSFPPFFICHFYYGCTALHLWLDKDSLSTLNRYNHQRYYPPHIDVKQEESSDEDEPDPSDDDNYIPPTHARKHHRLESMTSSPIQESTDASAFLVSWLWRANGVAMEEDGVEDPQTIIRKEFSSDKREFVEKWCQESC